MQIRLEPVAIVRSPRTGLEDDHWGDVESRIELVEGMAPESLDGIDAFTHLEIIFHFDQLPDENVEWKSRHPRGNPAWPKVGIFAQRAAGRPNRLGATMVRLVGREGRALIVRGLDAADGTPVLDIKPVMRDFLPRGEVRQPQWATQLMHHYWVS
ncbi:MAG TPA: SAM-dependent methyltransferase [Gemmatimonadales bacterium]|nr:SAM-dependent methyltransferase [Gemmatimonadales bacterium]